MSALRMIAYGVLEDHGSFPALPTPKPEGYVDPYAERRKARSDQRHLVKAELLEHDLLLLPAVYQKSGSGAYRAYPGKFVLYGPAARDPLQGKVKSWVVRGILAEGSYRDCCIAAVRYMEPNNEALRS